MKRLFALLLIVCLLAGCGDEGAYVPTGGGFQDGSTPPSQAQAQTPTPLRLSYNRNGSMHPYTATDLNNRSLLCLVYQGLFSLDKTISPPPFCVKATRCPPI